MSSNTNTSRYKQVNRQARIQTREGAFSKGMLFTDKPLTEGYSKLLVNYDIDLLDGTLHTRKGLQAVGVYEVTADFPEAQLFEMNKGFTNIIASKPRSLVKAFQNNTAKNTSLATDVVTYNTSTNALNVVSLSNFTDEDHTTMVENITNTRKYFFKDPYAIQPLCDGNTDPYQVIPYAILEPSVHGQLCTHNLYFKKPIGTFAFGNAYYSFIKHTVENVTKNELHYVQYYTEKTRPIEGLTTHPKKTNFTTEGDLYDYHVVPQKLNPSEAATAGYNMLAENPYDFECEDGGNIAILGVLPYAGDAPLLKPILNQDVLLKCYYRAPINTEVYQLTQMSEGDYWYYEDTFATAEDLNAPYSLTYTHNLGDGTITLGEPFTDFNLLKKGTVLYSTAVVGDGAGKEYNTLYKHKVISDSPRVDSTNARSIKASRTEYRSQKLENSVYRVIWEWREVGATTWNPIKEELVSFTKLNKSPLICNFNSAAEQVIIRITISNINNTVTQPDGTEIEYVESATAFGLRFSISNTEGAINAVPKKYDLSTAKGMLEWKNRLVLWGVEDAETVLFTSDVNNPAYFPYPNNIDILDEPIIHCMLYGDDLLAFTNTKLYRLTIGETGGIGAHALIQKNLNITERDIPMFCLVKNLLFFKSGNYYYMLTPKSSSIVGETTIAPISNSIYPFLDNFSTEVDKLFSIYTQGKTDPDLKQEYPWQYPLSSFLEYYYAYTDNENVVLNFVYDYSGFIKGYPDFDETFSVEPPSYNPETNSWELIDFSTTANQDYCRPKDKRQFILSLIYNTSAYAWSIKIYEAPNILQPVQHNSIGQQDYMYLTVQTRGNTKGPLFIQCTKQGTEDALIVYEKNRSIIDYTSLKTFTDFSDFTEVYLDVYYRRALQPNYQYLDTGYRILTSAVDIKKRFREIQFSINNVSQKALTFYTAFIVDGNLRKDMRGYTTKMMVDPDDPRTGVLLVERPYIDERYLPSVPDYVIQVKDYVSPDTTPGDTTLDDTFVLDNTQFPDLAYWKVRVGVSGKGFVPRLQILSVNDKEYSLLSTNWVYRTMNSR